MSIQQHTKQQPHLFVGSVDVAPSFHTQTSTSFDVRSKKHFGWVDVHFPCHGPVKVQIRGALPDECLETSWIRQLVPALFEYLKIPKEETFEATFFKPVNVVKIGQSTNQAGETDRINTMRTFGLPKSNS
jgi:hypothetical protein